MIVANESKSWQKTAMGLALAGALVGGAFLPRFMGSSSRRQLYILAGMLALSVGSILFVRPRWGTYLVILSFPVLAAIPRGAYVPGLKLDEVLIIVSLLMCLVRRNVNKIQLTKIDYAYLFMFLMGTVLPVLGVVARGQSPDWAEVIALLKQYALYRLIVMTLNSRSHLSRAVVLLLLPSLLVSVVALLQLLDVASIRSLLSDIYYEGGAFSVGSQVYRATATLSNWNSLGGYAALGACLSLALIRHRKALMIPWLAPVALAANLSMLMLAGSSSSVVGFMSGAFVWWILRSRRARLQKRHLLYILLILVVGSVVLVVAGQAVLQKQIERQRPSEVVDRATGRTVVISWVPRSVVVRWLLARYLFGLIAEDGLALLTGFGVGEDALALLPWGTAESGYMTMLFFYGPLFVLAYLVLLRVIVSQARRIRKHLKADDELGMAITTAVISITFAMGVMNIISTYYSEAGVTHYFWTVIGCMMVLPRLYGGQEPV